MSQNLIDMDLVEKLQKQFGSANNIYLACLDSNRKVLSSCYCTGGEQRFFEERIPKLVMERLLDHAKKAQVESVIEETLETPYVKLCVVINRVEEENILIWVAVAVIEERLTPDDMIPEYVLRISEEEFYRTIGFLETVSKQFFAVKEQEIRAKEQIDKAVSTEQLFNDQLVRSEAMTEIVHLLESEDKFSAVASKILQRVCETLQIQGGCILTEMKEDHTVTVDAEFDSVGRWAFGEKIQGKKKIKIPFFNGKTYMLSSNSMMPSDLEKFFAKYHFKAAVFQPIETSRQTGRYLCFYQFDQKRVWSMEDIAFINDVKKVLLLILERQIRMEQFTTIQAAYASILDHVACAVYVADYDKKELLYFNEGFRKTIDTLFAPKGIEETFFSANISNAEDTFCELHLEEQKVWLELHQQKLKWVDGRTVCLGNIFDITEKKLFQQKVEYQVSADNLTGLYNRMRCEQDLEKYIKEAERTGKEGAFLCINLDDFKNINAAVGHSYGDSLLKAIAYNLSRVPGIEGDCYRINGDEFAVIVHGKEYKSLSRICKDLRAIFERSWFMKDVDYYCTMSMGVVCFPTDGNNVDDLSRKVTLALSTAKKKGKNCVEFYNEKIEATSVHRVDMEKNMRRATLNCCNEFEIYYQPILKRGENNDCYYGAEALVRWNSGEFGMIMPNDFLPLAEYLGLINPIGEYVLEEAASRCKYWNDCGHPNYKVHVNVSAIQLLQPDFASKVKQILHKTKLQPQNLVLEVTESLALNDIERMKQTLQQVKDLGVGVALDCFGAGCSSLNHIREIPMDIIKVDKCLTQKLGEDAFAESFVKMLAELAHTIGVSVAVVGVEKKAQLQYLDDISVELLQGYYYGEPMCVKEFEKI